MLIDIHVVVIPAAQSDRVLLEDVKVLTLHHGQMTRAQRSAPVPQVRTDQEIIPPC